MTIPTPLIPNPGLDPEHSILDLVNSMVFEWGTVSTEINVGGNTLSDSTKRWNTDIHKFNLLKVVAGTGLGQTATIENNSSNVIKIIGSWQSRIAAGDMYVIMQPGSPSPLSKIVETPLSLTSLAASTSSLLSSCSSVDLSTRTKLMSVTASCTFNTLASLGLRVHVRTSPDNTNWDTEDYDTWDLSLSAGFFAQRTLPYESDPMFMKFILENLDPTQQITNAKVSVAKGY